MPKDTGLLSKKTTGLVLFFFLSLGSLVGCSPDGSSKYTGTVHNLKIGLAPYIADFYGLLFLAEFEGYFTKNGLNITFVRMESGPDAFKALRQGSVDIGTGTEFPFAKEILNGHNVKVITTVWHGENLILAVRSDRGIQAPSDLRGKKVAVAVGTQLEFYLGRYLLKQSMTMEDIDIIDTNLHSLLTTFLSGDVHGVVFTEPDFTRAKMELEDKIDVWHITDKQPTYAVVVCRDELIKSHPDVIKRFLQALREAELYYKDDPQKAQTQILGHPARKDSPYGDRLSEMQPYGLFLDRSFLVMMEEETRWCIRSGNTRSRDVPNFLESIYFEGLESVKPHGVSIIR